MYYFKYFIRPVSCDKNLYTFKSSSKIATIELIHYTRSEHIFNIVLDYMLSCKNCNVYFCLHKHA